VRVRCCTDRRVVRTQLTDAGRAKVAAVQSPLEDAIAARFDHLSEPELLTLSARLTKLRGAVCPNAGE